LDIDKEVHTFIAFHTVHYAGVVDMLRFDPDPNLLLRLSPRGSDNCFPAIQMPGRDTVLPIPKASIETTK
jgi:hypothetical protein